MTFDKMPKVPKCLNKFLPESYETSYPSLTSYVMLVNVEIGLILWMSVCLDNGFYPKCWLVPTQFLSYLSTVFFNVTQKLLSVCLCRYQNLPLFNKMCNIVDKGS